MDDVQDNETGPTFSFQVKLSNNGSLVRCQVGNDSSPSISLQSELHCVGGSVRESGHTNPVTCVVVVVVVVVMFAACLYMDIQ